MQATLPVVWWCRGAWAWRGAKSRPFRPLTPGRLPCDRPRKDAGAVGDQPVHVQHAQGAAVCLDRGGDVGDRVIGRLIRSTASVQKKRFGMDVGHNHGQAAGEDPPHNAVSDSLTQINLATRDSQKAYSFAHASMVCSLRFVGGWPFRGAINHGDDIGLQRVLLARLQRNDPLCQSKLPSLRCCGGHAFGRSAFGGSFRCANGHQPSHKLGCQSRQRDLASA